jgi:hypothetical protein
LPALIGKGAVQQMRWPEVLTACTKEALASAS